MLLDAKEAQFSSLHSPHAFGARSNEKMAVLKLHFPCRCALARSSYNRSQSSFSSRPYPGAGPRRRRTSSFSRPSNRQQRALCPPDGSALINHRARRARGPRAAIKCAATNCSSSERSTPASSSFFPGSVRNCNCSLILGWSPRRLVFLPYRQLRAELLRLIF